MAIMHDTARWIRRRPVMEHLRTRARRQALMLATIVVIACMPLAGWITGSYGVVLALLVPYAILVLLLAGATRFLADARPGRLDEWHRRQRQEAMAAAYWLGTSLALAGGLAIAGVVRAEVSEGLEGGTLVATLAMVTLLPTFVLAWRLPDDVVEVDDGQ